MYDAVSVVGRNRGLAGETQCLGGSRLSEVAGRWEGRGEGCEPTPHQSSGEVLKARVENCKSCFVGASGHTHGCPDQGPALCNGRAMEDVPHVLGPLSAEENDEEKH